MAIYYFLNRSVEMGVWVQYICAPVSSFIKRSLSLTRQKIRLNKPRRQKVLLEIIHVSKDGDIVKLWTFKPSALIPRVHSSYCS